MIETAESVMSELVGLIHWTGELFIELSCYIELLVIGE